MAPSDLDSTQTPDEKGSAHLEMIQSDVHPLEYYDENGIRIYGDGMDHDHEPPVRHIFFLCVYVEEPIVILNLNAK
jgi:hypothetical protein